MPSVKQIEAGYRIARERYQALGVNADRACAVPA